MTTHRRAFAPAVFLVSASIVMVVACSDEARPAGEATSSSGNGGSSSSSGGNPKTDAGADGSTDGATSDPDASSSGNPSDAGTDTGPTFECVNETSLSKDGGALPTSCDDSATCSARCQNLGKYFKVGTAQTGIDCLRQLPDCTDGPNVSSCFSKAVDATCDDDTAKTFCMSWVTACDPNAGTPTSLISELDCEFLSRALSAEGRTTLKACVDEKIGAGTCAQEVGQCIGKLQ